MTRAVPWGSTSVLLAALAAGAVWVLKPDPPRPVSRTVITLPPGQLLCGLDESAVAFSPDGSQVAHVAIQGDTQQIFLRSLDNPQPKTLSGTAAPQDTVRLLPLTRLKKNELRHREPEYLPGGKGLWFAASMSSFNWYETINASSLYSRRQSPPNLFLRPGKNTLGSFV